VRLSTGWPVLGIREHGRLVAAALVNEPTQLDFLDRFQEGLARLREELGAAAYGRLERFEEASAGNEPGEPHFFVGMVGVLPTHQGRGLGRRLLEAVRDMARQAGVGFVALSTEDVRNVPFYLHLGLEVVGEADVDELHTWGFRWCV
ncbi:MAG TPA: GNAT family N-acetyltransferase, partial [Longimicrobiales bacterium]|nr:GNAT family N-acetyltransferase [Longimicrobiales bacterium]